MLSGEQTIYRAKPHWIYLLTPAIFTAIGLSCTCCSLAGITTNPLTSQPPPPPESAQCLLVCSGGLLILALLLTILAILAYRTANFTLTDRRVIVEGGILSRRYREIFLNKVESVSVDHSLFGRLLGYGTVVITGSGGTKETLRWVANPLEIRRQIQDQISKL